MSDQKWRIVKEVIVTVVLGALAWEAMRTGYPVTSVVATGGIGIVNTVTVAQMYRAFRDVQAENREQFER